MGHLPIDPPGSWPALDAVVTRVVDTRAAIARLQAEESAILAEAGDLVLAREAERRVQRRGTANDIALREVTSELGAAMRLSDRTVQARMSTSSSLTMHFPLTFAAFQAGVIDAGHVGAIVDAGLSITATETRATYEALLLEAAQFETPPRLRAIARVVAARLDPETVEALQQRAHADRRVRIMDLEDGMARLLLDLPAVLAYAIHDRLTQMAHELITTEVEDQLAEPTDADSVAGDAYADDDRADASARTGATSGAEAGAGAGAGAEVRTMPDAGVDTEVVITGPTEDAPRRTMDQLRADCAVDLLLTAAPTAHGKGGALGAISAHVQVTIPVLTLACKSNEPALLAGYGPIDRDTAIALAAGAQGIDRIMFCHTNGAPIAVDRYRPTAELKRFLQVRDEHCRFPGCTQKPWRCDLDHTTAASHGGATSECNLANFCRRHHTVKHATDWTVKQLGQGVLEWTSPTGRHYLDRPPALVQFVPSPGFDLPQPPGIDPPPF